MNGFRHERLLDARDLLRAFRGHEERLAVREVRAHVYVVGGAAMVMAYRRSRTTMDVGALTMGPRETVLRAASEVAQEQGLSETWLNDQVRTGAKVPVVADERAKVPDDSPHLVVTGASAWHMLAMILHAARRRDEEDIKWLMRRVGVRTMAGAEEVQREVFRDESGIPGRCHERIGRLLRQVRQEQVREWRREPPRRDFGPER